MSNTFFSFKQFVVHHDKCAMKVGTDGVLLGATAVGGQRILDIGTGTGLVALMMAQRFPHATVTAIDIDSGAVSQARENVCRSPFASRIKVLHADACTFATDRPFDCIVCNPPFFEESLGCPDEQRNTARHTSALPFAALMQKAAELLTGSGTLTLIVPTDKLSRIEESCAYASLFVNGRIFIKTTQRKEPKRVVLFINKSAAVSTSSSTVCLMENGARSPWYCDVCKEFYL